MVTRISTSLSSFPSTSIVSSLMSYRLSFVRSIFMGLRFSISIAMIFTTTTIATTIAIIIADMEPYFNDFIPVFFFSVASGAVSTFFFVSFSLLLIIYHTFLSFTISSSVSSQEPSL